MGVVIFPKNIIFSEIRKDSSNKSTVFFELEKAKIKKLNRQLLLEPELIRFLIVNDVIAKETEEAPAPLTEEVPDAKKETVKATPVETTKETPVSTSKKKIDEAIKKTAKKELTPLKKKPAPKKKEAVSDTERLKQLENKLQDLLKE